MASLVDTIKGVLGYSGNPFFSDSDRGIFDKKTAYVSDLTSLATFARGNVTSVIVRDPVRGGSFSYDSGISSFDNGVNFPALGGGGWVRQNPAIANVKWWDAKGDNATNDTTSIQAAINYVSSIGGGVVFVPRGTYRVRDITLPRWMTLRGEGYRSLLRFQPSGTPANDATSYVLRSTGSYSLIENLAIDGYTSTGYSVGNGLFVTPDSNGSGLLRTIRNITIQSFAGYKASPVGGTFGVNSNYAREDISDGNRGHLLIGGNGLIVDPNGATNWNLTLDNVDMITLDGIGMSLGKITDSKISNCSIGGCVSNGFVLDGNNKNVQISNIKVFLCRVLNQMDDFNTKLSKLIPHELTNDNAAVILTGANIQVKNFEAQENGSNGFQLGSAKYSLSNSTLDLIADGNGGCDPSVDAPTQANYRRFGIFLFNYYSISITGIADDFRAKQNYPRQLRALHVLGSKPEFSAVNQIQRDNWYKIKAIGAGTDFTPYQLGLGSPSNAIGKLFQVRSTGDGGLSGAGSFGSGGILQAINDRLNINMMVVNQYEVDQGTGSGYNLVNDGGNSNVILNGVSVSVAPGDRSITGNLNVSGNETITGNSTANAFLPASPGSTVGDGSHVFASVYAAQFLTPAGVAMFIGPQGLNSLNIGTGGFTRIKIFGTGNVAIGPNSGTATDNGTSLQAFGSFSVPVITKTGNYTIGTGDGTILGDATSASHTQTLPAASGHTRIYTIKKIDSGTNTVTVACTGSDVISSATDSATYVLTTKGKYVLVQSDGAAKYHVIGGN